MTMLSKARLTVYITGLLGGGALVLQAMGLATYDAAAGTIDLAPISLTWLAGGIVTLIAPALAAVANVRKW